MLLLSTLFSVLGVSSYVLLISGARIEVQVYWLWAVLFFVFAFNVIGHTILWLNVFFERQYPLYIKKRSRVVAMFLLIALLLFVLNYGLLVVAKALAGARYPFVFQNGGESVLIIVWLVELLVVILLVVNRSMLDTMRLQRESAALRDQNNSARYQALQNQLNPHFLFNSLNTLVAEIEYDPSNAVHFTRNLSDVYRYVLQSQNARLAGVADELSFARSYIFLHRVRLGDCIEMAVDVSSEATEASLPPLTLQLLVENVIKHNSITVARPMRIEITERDGWLVVSNRVSAKIDRSPVGVKSGTGLRNLQDRYTLLCGRQIVVERAAADHAEMFVVKIPLLDL